MWEQQREQMSEGMCLRRGTASLVEAWTPPEAIRKVVQVVHSNALVDLRQICVTVERKMHKH